MGSEGKIMTKDETTLLAEVANDVKWLKSNIEQNALSNNKQLNDINTYLKMLNGSVKANTIWRRVITGVGGVALLAIAGAILKLAMG